MLNFFKRWHWKQGRVQSYFSCHCVTLTGPSKTPLTFKQFDLASYNFRVVNILSIEPNKEHLRHVLLFLLNQKKNASESRRILV